MSLCPKPDVCGSCGWSHIPYEKQLQQKLSDINGSFALKKLDLRVDEIFPSPKTEHYRNRMDFVINFKGDVGLREKGKWWKVIDDHTCFLADEQIDTAFAVVRDWVKTCGLSYFDRKSNIGTLRYAVIRSTTLGETMVTIITSAPNGENQLGENNQATLVDFNDDAEKIEAALRDLSERISLDPRLHGINGDPTHHALRTTPLTSTSDARRTTSVIWAINHTISDTSFGDELRVIAGPGTIEESIDGVRFNISPNAFFQTNSHAAPMLLSTVREFAGDLTDKTLLDLYCGTGFFAVAMAGQAKQTIGVELVADAINDAKVNAELNNLELITGSDSLHVQRPTHDALHPTSNVRRTTSSISFHDAKTEEFDWMKLGADVVILDPPRSGMHDRALADVISAKPERIVYVSCNYKNFAREMVELSKYYDVENIRAVDMFPHTPHVELVTALVRKSS